MQLKMNYKICMLGLIGLHANLQKAVGLYSRKFGPQSKLLFLNVWIYNSFKTVHYRVYGRHAYKTNGRTQNDIIIHYNLHHVQV